MIAVKIYCFWKRCVSPCFPSHRQWGQNVFWVIFLCRLPCWDAIMHVKKKKLYFHNICCHFWYAFFSIVCFDRWYLPWIPLEGWRFFEKSLIFPRTPRVLKKGFFWVTQNSASFRKNSKLVEFCSQGFLFSENLSSFRKNSKLVEFWRNVFLVFSEKLKTRRVFKKCFLSVLGKAENSSSFRKSWKLVEFWRNVFLVF